MATDGKFNAQLTLPFTTTREAEIVYDVLRVDSEPKRSSVKKDLKVEDNCLVINLSAPEARNLRVAVNSIMENVILSTQTIEMFGPPVSEKYSHY